jgi:hypothetical protein
MPIVAGVLNPQSKHFTRLFPNSSTLRSPTFICLLFMMSEGKQTGDVEARPKSPESGVQAGHSRTAWLQVVGAFCLNVNTWYDSWITSM